MAYREHAFSPQTRLLCSSSIAQSCIRYFLGWTIRLLDMEWAVCRIWAMSILTGYRPLRGSTIRAYIFFWHYRSDVVWMYSVCVYRYEFHLRFNTFIYIFEHLMKIHDVMPERCTGTSNRPNVMLSNSYLTSILGLTSRTQVFTYQVTITKTSINAKSKRPSCSRIIVGPEELG